MTLAVVAIHAKKLEVGNAYEVQNWDEAYEIAHDMCVGMCLNVGENDEEFRESTYWDHSGYRFTSKKKVKRPATKAVQIITLEY